MCLFFCDANVFMICMSDTRALSFPSDVNVCMFFACVLCFSRVLVPCECVCEILICKNDVGVIQMSDPCIARTCACVRALL